MSTHPTKQTTAERTFSIRMIWGDNDLRQNFVFIQSCCPGSPEWEKKRQNELADCTIEMERRGILK